MRQSKPTNRQKRATNPAIRAGVKAREIAARKMAAEHKALAKSSSSAQERIHVLEFHNASLAADAEQVWLDGRSWSVLLDSTVVFRLFEIAY